MVWEKPMRQLAGEFGLSDVGLAKACKKHDIPRPPRGYWARLAAGQKPRKIPLPKGEDISISFDAELNTGRRAELQADREVSAAIRAEVGTLAQISDSHELAVRVEKVFQSGRVAEDGRITVSRHTTPSIAASPESAKRIVEFLSGLAFALEKRGVKLVSGKSDGESLRFQREDDMVHLSIDEALEFYEVEPTPEQKREPSWTWNNSRSRPCGRLSFRLTSPSGTCGRCKWTESSSNTALDLLPKVIAGIESLFNSWEENRKRQAQREAERIERERLYAQKEVQNRHISSLREVDESRTTSLLRAAEWFRIYKDLLALIEASESCWRKDGQLSPEQRAWVAWAREKAEELNPLATGYPDPATDGPFDEGSIPVGGPYPKSTEFPMPHSLREIGRLLKHSQPSTYAYRGW